MKKKILILAFTMLWLSNVFAQLSSKNGKVIGKTTYDLQTNASIQNRLIAYPDGTISACWTFSGDLSTKERADRGTGYNYFDGISWMSEPTQRIESSRVGFPSIVSINGNEIITAHNTETDEIYMNKRPIKGAGNWTETAVTNANLILLWNRTAVGGVNNNILHMIGITAPKANGGALYRGMDGKLLYYRSLDGGLSWDIENFEIPGIDSNRYHSGLSGDSYSIHARGNKVVVLLESNIVEDVYVYISEDNGITWTNKRVFDNKLPEGYSIGAAGSISDIDGDGDADSLYVAGSGFVFLDENLMVHAFLPLYFMKDDETAAAVNGKYTYYPFTSEIAYWNESFGEDNMFTISRLKYLDDGDTTRAGKLGVSGIAEYNQNFLLSSFSGGLDQDGNIYLLFSSYMGNLDNGTKNYRHIFAMKSTNNGYSWSESFDVTSNDDYSECVFPSVAFNVRDSVQFIFQEDDEPGMNVQPSTNNTHSIVDNKIVFASIYKNDTNFDIDSNGTCIAYIKGENNACLSSTDSIYIEAVGGTAYAWASGATTSGRWIKTYGDYPIEITTACGKIADTFSIVAPVSAADINIMAESMVYCDGSSETVELSVQNSTGSTYEWSTMETTNTIYINATGKYYVTVTNCAGSSEDSISITSATMLTQDLVNLRKSNYFRCQGDSIILTANDGLYAKYKWSTGIGDTTSRVKVMSAGTYYVTVTNCAGSVIDTIEVKDKSLSSVEIETVGTNPFCEGIPIFLYVKAGNSWKWSNGDTTNIIKLTEYPKDTGNYSVTVTDICGASISVTNNDIFISGNKRPDPPEITINENICTSSSDVNRWFLNGTLQKNETGKVFKVSSFSNNVKVTAQQVDVNGCISKFSNVLIYTSVDYIKIGLENLFIYPNPAKDFIQIESTRAKAGNYKIQIINLLGEIIYTNKLNVQSTISKRVDISKFTKGVYLINISNNSSVITSKLIIE